MNLPPKRGTFLCGESLNSGVKAAVCCVIRGVGSIKSEGGLMILAQVIQLTGAMQFGLYPRLMVDGQR